MARTQTAVSEDIIERLVRLEAEHEVQKRDLDRALRLIEDLAGELRKANSKLTEIHSISTHVGEIQESMKNINKWIERGMGVKGLVTFGVIVMVTAGSVATAWQALRAFMR